MAGWRVSQEQSGVSLQAFLKGKLGSGVSAKQIKRMLDAGKCTLNGKSERFATRLVGNGDRIEIELEQGFDKEHLPKLDGDERILYSDDQIVAYNKPPGIASDSNVLADVLCKRFGRVILLHRLDKDTSGVLLFARTEEAAKAIEVQFKQREIKKTYFAIVDGVPQKPSGTIDNFLGKLSVYQGQTLWGAVSQAQGLPARTQWQLEKAGKQASLIKCLPETGRTHQLRVHLSGMGHPILGDHQYGRTFTCRYNAPRVLLHAAEIAFRCPANGKNVIVSAPIPQDFNEALNQLVKSDG